MASAVRAEIVIATVGPMKGPFAGHEDQMKQGAELTVADLNAKGGVLGQKVKLIVGDDACNPEVAVTIANFVVNQEAVLLLNISARLPRSPPRISTTRTTSC
ncbi:MAG: ABC transporter substrate-binding protein [Alphaproteobacteria bacterium]